MRDGGALRLSAVNRQAARLGLMPGLPLADARARCPELLLREADGAADAAFLEQMGDWCQRFTPLVALAQPDALVLDVTGAAHLFGGEPGLARAVEAAFHRRGLTLRAAIAGSATLAEAVARFGAQTQTVLPLDTGEEGETIAALPVAALGPDQAAARLLRRAGLETVGAVALQPREALLARFGRALLDALDRLTGVLKAPFQSRHTAPLCLAERAFAEPVTVENVILATLTRLMGDIATLLERRGQGARRIAALFFRTDGTVTRLEIATARAVRDPAVIERLFRERLKALADPFNPGFGFDLLRLKVLETAPFDADAGTMEGLVHDAGAERAAAAAAFAALADQLSTRMGADQVRMPVAVASHVPERAEWLAPAQVVLGSREHAGAADPLAPARLAGAPPARPLRLFNPPEPIEALADVPDGPPARFRWRRVLHQVARAEGPERIAPEWWLGGQGGQTRDYFRVEDATGRRFWLFREGLYGETALPPRWFMHGLFA